MKLKNIIFMVLAVALLAAFAYFSDGEGIAGVVMAVSPVAAALKNRKSEVKTESFQGIHWEYWSRVFTKAASSTQTLDFFTDVVTGMTNMEQAGQIPKGYSFDINHIALNIFNLDGTAFFNQGGASPSISPLNAIIAQGSMSIIRGQTTDFMSTLTRFFQPMNYFNGGTPSSNLCATVVYPLASTTGKRRLLAPITIIGGKTFKGQMTITTQAAALGYTVANTVIEMVLEGILIRSK
jgi:hypothetical protein